MRTARAEGVAEWLVICRHALKNAALPLVTVTGLQFGLLLGGAVITETVFAVPGIGSVNFLVDVLYVYLNPQIRVR